MSSAQATVLNSPRTAPARKRIEGPSAWVGADMRAREAEWSYRLSATEVACLNERVRPTIELGVVPRTMLRFSATKLKADVHQVMLFCSVITILDERRKLANEKLPRVGEIFLCVGDGFVDAFTYLIKKSDDTLLLRQRRVEYIQFFEFCFI